MITKDLKTDIQILRLKLFEAIDDEEFGSCQQILIEIPNFQKRKTLLKSKNGEFLQ